MRSMNDLQRMPTAVAARRAPFMPRLSWLKPLGMIGLSLYNFGMRILTLGIYHFWGKTEVRKRVWSAIRIDGEPLEYTGTGGELFRGFLVIFGIILIPVMLATFAVVVAYGPESPVTRVYQVGLYAAFLLLTGVAIYRAQRYRLARTRWRGIRAALVGNSWRYGWTYFWTMLLIPLTLGWISPWRSTKLQAMTTNDMRFGTLPFRFSAPSGPLYRPFAAFWGLMAIVLVALPLSMSATLDLPSLFVIDPDTGEMAQPDPQRIAELVALIYIGLFLIGVIWMILSAWYRAAMIRHFASHTHLDKLGFASSVTAGGLMWITLSNFVLLMLGAILTTMALGGLIVVAAMAFFLSMGMLLPVTQARSTGYLVRRMQLSGSLDAAAIEAGAHQDIKRGEGLAQAFEIDAL